MRFDKIRKNKKEKETNLKMKKRVLAALLTVTMLFQAIPESPIYAGETGNQIVLETSDEFTLSYQSLYYMVGDEQVECAKNGEKYTIDTARHSTLNVTGIGGELDVAIDDDALATLAKGDYISFTFPDVLQVEEDNGTITNPDPEVTIAKYSIHNNELKLILDDAVDTDGIYDIHASVAFEATLDHDKVGELDQNDYEIAPATRKNPATYLTLPKISNEVTGLTKQAGEVLVDDETGRTYVDWTITVGSDTSSAGLDLGGLVVHDIPETEGLTIAGAYLGGQYGNGTQLQSVSEDENEFAVTLADGVKAPATIVVRTYVEQSLLEKAYQNAFEDSDAETTASNSVSVEQGESALTIAAGSENATDSVVIPYTHIEKSGVQVSGNAMDWTIVVNSEQTDFYQCIVSDILSTGLTVDETHGIAITRENGSDIQLNAQNTADASTGISYALTEENGQQKLAISFGDTGHAGFSDTYTIVFRTNIAVDYQSDSQSLDSSVSNRAYVQALYPTYTGGGSGTGRVWGAPSVTTEFRATYIEKNVLEANDETGLIQWEILPGTKISDYTTAVITDEMEADYLALVQDSIEVTYEDGTAVSDGVYTFTQNGSQLKFEFDRSAIDADQKTLDDIRITYQTKALEYFRSNDEHEYVNRATISIAYDANHTYTDSDTASVKMKNELLKKTVEVLHDDENHVSYFHFAIPLNKKNMTLENVSLIDSLATAFTTDAGNPIPTDYYTIAAAGNGNWQTRVVNAAGTVDTTANITVDDAAKTVSVQWDDPVTESKTAHIYVSFDPDRMKPQADLSQAVISADNTVVLSSDTLESADHTFSARAVSNNQSKLDNHVLKKSGSFVASDDSIAWTLTVNRAHADISNHLVITDVLSKGLAFDKSTFKVMKHETDVTSQATVEMEPQLNGTTILTIHLPAGTTTESYVITYSSAITTTDATLRTTGLSNAAFIGTAQDEFGRVNCNVAASAKSSGSAKARVILHLSKVDASSTATDPIPVAQALYGLYSDAACQNLVYSAFTEADGSCSLLAPYSSSNHVYYVKEVNSTHAISTVNTQEGSYTADETVYGPYDFSSPGNKQIAPLKNGAEMTGLQAAHFVDERMRDVLGEITIEKHYAVATGTESNQKVGVSVQNQSSTFTLYLYPDGVEGHGRVKMDTYTSSASDENGMGSFTISDLPFGLYGLVETTAADGYQPSAVVHYFNVDTTGSTAVITKGSNWSVDPAYADRFVIDNVSTDVIVDGKNSDNAALTDDTEWELTGDMLIDGTDTGSDDKIRLTGTQLAQGLELLGVLKTGKTYRLTPVKVQSGYVTPIATVFSVDQTGKIVLSTRGNATVTGKKLTITQNPTSFAFALKDEFGDPVTDAQIQIREKDTQNVVAEYQTTETAKTYRGIFVAGKEYEVTEVNPETVHSTAESLLTFKVNGQGSALTNVTNADDALKGAVERQTTLAMVNRRVLAQLQIKKYDAYDGQLISSEAEFTIHRYTGSIDNPTEDVVVGTIVTDTTGIAKTADTEALRKGLPVGNYYAIETQAPVGYELATDKLAFTVANADADTTITRQISDERRTGNMRLTVTSEGTASLDHAQFGIYTYDENGQTYDHVKDITVSQNGTSSAVGTATDLTWGVEYYVKALDVPSGYQYDGSYHGPYVINAQCTDATVEAEIAEAVTSVTLVKRGQKCDGTEVAALSGAQFAVTGIFAGSAGSETRNFETGNDGSFTISNLIVAGNRYLVEETGAPQGYGTIAPFAFVVDEYGHVTRITAPDESDTINPLEVSWVQSGNAITRIVMTDWMTGFTLKSTADDNTKMVGHAEFVITSEDGAVTYQTVEARQDGTVWIEGLVPGTYRIEETSVIPGFNQTKPVVFAIDRDNTMRIIETEGNAQEYSFAGAEYSRDRADAPVLVMDHQTNQLTFTTSLRCYNGNEDETVGNLNGTIALPGVHYVVYSDITCTTPVPDENGDPITIESELSGDRAIVSIASLNLGETYYLRAQSIDDQGLIIMDEKVYSATVDGEHFAGLVEVESGETLHDVVFEVRRGTIGFKTVSQDDHSEGVEGAVYGLYQLESTIEDPTEEKTIFTYIKEKAEELVHNIVVLLFGDESTDPDSNEYRAVIEDQGKDYMLVKTATTDEEGNIVFDDVVAGKVYLIKELTAPEGYATSSETVEVELDYDEESGETKTVMEDSDVWVYDDETGTYIWKSPVIRVAVYLTDTSDHYLAGGVLQLVDDDGNVIKTSDGQNSWVTEESEKQLFEGNLAMGSKYTVKQLAAPSGYEVSETTFVVDATAREHDEAYVQDVVVIDRKIVKEEADNKKPKKEQPKSESENTQTGNTQTGDHASERPFVLLFAAGVCFVLSGMFYHRKKHDRRR